MHKQLTPSPLRLRFSVFSRALPPRRPTISAQPATPTSPRSCGAAHKDLACTTCHTGTEAHLKDMKKRPAVNMDRPSAAPATSSSTSPPS